MQTLRLWSERFIAVSLRGRKKATPRRQNSMMHGVFLHGCEERGEVLGPKVYRGENAVGIFLSDILKEETKRGSTLTSAWTHGGDSARQGCRTRRGFTAS